MGGRALLKIAILASLACSAAQMSDVELPGYDRLNGAFFAPIGRPDALLLYDAIDTLTLDNMVASVDGSPKVTIIELASHGSVLWEAIAIAKEIRARGLNTYPS